MFYAINKVDINNDKIIHKLSAEFLIVQNSSSIPLLKLELKVEALIMLL